MKSMDGVFKYSSSEVNRFRSAGNAGDGKSATLNTGKWREGS